MNIIRKSMDYNKGGTYMNKIDYANPLGNQALSLPSMIDTQLDHCFSQDVLEKLLSMAESFDIRKIYITGCGDSIAAAGAMAPVVLELSGVMGCQVFEAIDFTRFTTISDIGIGEPNSPLVIGISAGGGTARVVEALKKANEIGAFPVLLSNKEESKAGNEAKRTFFLNTPKMENDFPGLRSYLASMIGLIALAARLGQVRGVLPPTGTEELKKAIRDYVHSYEPLLENIDNQMFELAKEWKDLELFNFIGDGPQMYSALFAMDKFVEVAGVHCNYDDSEDWCHIDHHILNPETVGTVIFIDKNSPSFSRSLETVKSACGIKRPVLVVTNADKSLFPEEANVCIVPETREGYEWMLPLMDYVPAAILAGYCSTLGGRKFFNVYNPATNKYDGEMKFFDQNNMTTSNSKIEIYK